MATTNVPDRNGDSVRSSTGQATPYMFPIIDDMHDQAIAGMSPVSGLMHGDPDCNSDWEVTAINPTWKENVRIDGGMNTTLGSWPVQNYGNDPRQLSASGDGPRDWTGHEAGDLPG